MRDRYSLGYSTNHRHVYKFHKKRKSKRERSHIHRNCDLEDGRGTEKREREREKEVIKSSSRDIELNLLTQRVELKVYLVIYDYIAM